MARNVFRRLRTRYAEMFSDLAPLGGVSSGNTISIFSSGSATFSAMWDDMERAQSRLWLGTYTLEPDAIGEKTLQTLADAKASGVEDVLLMYDAVGSLRLNSHHLDPLIAAGVRVVPFNPIYSWSWPWVWQASLRDPLVRNHRKLLIIDDAVAFAGGMNVASEYAGSSVGGSSFFKDVHVRVNGPAVHHLASVFEDSLAEAQLFAAETKAGQSPPKRAAAHASALVESGGSPELSTLASHVSTVNLDVSVSAQTKARLARFAKHVPALRNMYSRLAMYSLKLADNPVHITNVAPANTQDGAAPSSAPPGDVVVQVLYSNARRGKYAIQRAMALSLLKAKDSCYMTTPYFIPPRWLTKQLIRAARRGVDVRILTAGKTDVPIYRLAALHVYDLFLRNGVRIYELDNKALHAKTMTIDSMYASVGSFNLDLLSSHRNLEVVLSFFDPRLTSALETQISDDMASAREITRDLTAQRSRTAIFVQAAVYRLLNFLFSWKG